VLVIIIAVVVIAVILTRVKSADVLDDFKEEREKIKEPRKKPVKVHRYSRQEEIKVRYYYLRFLRRCRKKKIDLITSDTTQQIQGKYLMNEEQKKDTMSRFTEIYRRNRYDERHHSSRQEASEMKNLQAEL